jgi:hypothetical protein
MMDFELRTTSRMRALVVLVAPLDAWLTLFFYAPKTSIVFKDLAWSHSFHGSHIFKLIPFNSSSQILFSIRLNSSSNLSFSKFHDSTYRGGIDLASLDLPRSGYHVTDFCRIQADLSNSPGSASTSLVSPTVSATIQIAVRIAISSAVLITLQITIRLAIFYSQRASSPRTVPPSSIQPPKRSHVPGQERIT